MKESLRNLFIRFITPKRALLDLKYLFTKFTVFNFIIGIVLAIFFTLVCNYLSTMFLLGSIIGLSIGLILTVKYCFYHKPEDIIILSQVASITFSSPRYISKEVEKRCCGMKSNFCGWVFGVDSENGMKQKGCIKQELHATIRGTKLIMSIPSSRLSRRTLNSKVMLSRDMFEYRRVVDLHEASITLNPKFPEIANKWGLKSPISILLSTNTNFKRRKKEQWKSTNYSYFKSYLESKFKILQCKTKTCTRRYLKRCLLDPKSIYFCFTSCPDKEIWFRNLKLASYGFPVNPHLWEYVQPFISSKKQKANKIKFSYRYPEFIKYMAKYMPKDWIIFKNRPAPLTIEHIKCSSNVLWINVIIARIFWDLIEKNVLKDKIILKIHKKIQKMQLPVYIKDIGVENIDIGYNMPIIKSVEQPYLDTFGWWVNINVYYDGGFSVSLATKVDLMKLKEDPKQRRFTMQFTNMSTLLKRRSMAHMNVPLTYSDIEKFEITGKSTNNSIRYLKPSFRFASKRSTLNSSDIYNKPAAFDSEEEESESISSSDNEISITKKIQLKEKIFGLFPKKKKKAPEVSQNKVLKVIESIGRSKYFQKATNNRFIRHGLKVFASKKIMLQLEVNHFSGTVVLHLPRPPSDRIWYGLKESPDLKITIIPIIGERRLNFARITNWIEKKIKYGIKNALVYPNMDDFRLPQQTT